MRRLAPLIFSTLLLAILAAALPAAAAPTVRSGASIVGPTVEPAPLWQRLVGWLVAVVGASDEATGPDMDPNGLWSPPPGEQSAGSTDEGDTGPWMDPNG